MAKPIITRTITEPTTLTILPIPAGSRAPNLTGETWGYLTVVGYAGRKRGHTMWHCYCNLCGTIKAVSGTNLTSSKQRTCGQRGCKRIVRADNNSPFSIERTAWNNMVQRCTNPTHPNYPRYGGKGLTVCDEWRESFDQFLSDVGPSPGKGYSLDRLDNTKGYVRGNVAWRTYKDQALNRSTTVWITVRGTRIRLMDAAEFFGIPYATLWQRVQVLGWSAEKAVSTPVQTQHHTRKVKTTH